MERDALNVGPAGDIGGGPAFAGTSSNPAHQKLAFVMREPRIEPGIDVIGRQMQGFKDEESRLIERVKEAGGLQIVDSR